MPLIVPAHLAADIVLGLGSTWYSLLIVWLYASYLLGLTYPSQVLMIAHTFKTHGFDPKAWQQYIATPCHGLSKGCDPSSRGPS